MATDEKDLEGDEEAGEKGGNMMLIIIIAVVVLLIGGGVAAFFLLSGAEEGAEGAETAEAASSENGESGEAVEKGPASYFKFKGGEFIVHLPPGSSVKMMQVEMQVLTYDPATLELMNQHDPMLRHHVNNILESQDANNLFKRAGRESLQAEIKKELETKLKTFNENISIDDVYFTQFVMQ